jgi:ABC-2 type transport system permease protein
VVNVPNSFAGHPAKAFSDFVAKGVCIAKKDAKCYYFKPQIAGFGILIPAFIYLSFSLGREIPPNLLVPGLVGMVSLFGASSIEATSIPIEMQTGTYELLQTAPVSTANVIFGKSLAGSAYGILLSLVTASGAAILTGGAINNPLLFVIALITGTFAFSALGMLLASAAKDMPTANIGLTALRLPMVFISGVFIPIQDLSVQLRFISYLVPLTYVVDALRVAMIAPNITFAVDVAALLVWAIALQMLAVIVLNKKMEF